MLSTYKRSLVLKQFLQYLGSALHKKTQHDAKEMLYIIQDGISQRTIHMQEFLRGWQRSWKSLGLVICQKCKGFKCTPLEIGAVQNCCCRRILYNQPDFTNVKSLLEEHCKDLGVLVLFLPKFHCELNFIEQCWVYAKCLYRLCPESSREDQLKKNALQSLKAITLNMMRKFATWSQRFMDAYDQGLNGWQAAWATHKYHGHRVIPTSIMDELEEAGIV